ncbi:MAG: anaerobic ribonucleoside-triphosphate reductase activating protein [Patescibacteria group bacterium]|nr:anaerobic ribonucleoside-triphosphate reductase activating protein [Patescibacteria group bacterium]MDD5295196.1 anaerobic ribonucleoside-triphosphate reductase activating protein [Patescibacteria group bacterium]MDD5554754.1 anaerobic ribonucleoside-triphosphate reductase activating protein [Patescibacteria group bacterium]
MLIGGLQKFSLLDYPGRIAAIIFTKGCNFRCHFCYNPMLVWPEKKAGRLKNISSISPVKSVSVSNEASQKDHALIREDGLFDFLTKRRNKLEGVVITGGEPTLHKDLPGFIKKIKKLGYLVKLDTNGTKPEMLEKLIKEKLVDYLAMDIKAPEDKYQKVVNARVDFKKIEKSVRIIRESGLPHEFRTTMVPGLLGKEDIEKIGRLIKGADNWFLQKFKGGTDLVDESFQGLSPFKDKEMGEMVKTGRKYAERCEAR